MAADKVVTESLLP